MQLIDNDSEYLSAHSHLCMMKILMTDYENKQGDLARKGSWNPTISGGRFWIEDPRPEEVLIEDIAYNLSRINRFNGASLGEPYSVAQHCFLGSFLIDEEYALEFLLHDAAEAYTGDIVTYVKNVIREKFEIMEHKINLAVAEKFNLKTDSECEAQVKKVDLQMLKAEAYNLLPYRTLPGLEKIDFELEFQTLKIEPLNWQMAETVFLERFRYLWEKREQKNASLKVNMAADGLLPPNG